MHLILKIEKFIKNRLENSQKKTPIKILFNLLRHLVYYICFHIAIISSNRIYLFYLLYCRYLVAIVMFNKTYQSILFVEYRSIVRQLVFLAH